MMTKYFLDTNIFWKVLYDWNSGESSELIAKLKNGSKLTFSLSEITAMEIHSVLGKYIRGKQRQEINCERTIKDNGNKNKCSHVWIKEEERPILNKREAQVYIRLLSDILNSISPDFNIEIIRLDNNILEIGRILLERYAYKQDFRSLDATIAATIIEKHKSDDLIVLTRDRKFKNVLIAEEINCE